MVVGTTATGLLLQTAEPTVVFAVLVVAVVLLLRNRVSVMLLLMVLL